MNGLIARTAVVAGALLAAVGCGGSSTHGGGDDDAGSGGAAASGGGSGTGQGGSGATSTSGGTGGTGRGGSGATSTSGTGGVSGGLPAAAGLSISLSDPLESEVADLGSRSCPAGENGAFTYTVGKPAPGGTLDDGTSGTNVACVVTAEGSVVASLSGYDGNTKERIAFDVLSAVTDKLGMSLAKITFFTPSTLTLQALDGFPDCTIGPVTTLKTGAILADFRCPLLGAVDDTSVGCRAQGTLAFEYCGTE